MVYCCVISVCWTVLHCEPDFASTLIVVFIVVAVAIAVAAVLAGTALFCSLVFRFTLLNFFPMRVFIGFFIAVLNLVHAVFMRNESHAYVVVVAAAL